MPANAAPPVLSRTMTALPLAFATLRNVATSSDLIGPWRPIRSKSRPAFLPISAPRAASIDGKKSNTIQITRIAWCKGISTPPSYAVYSKPASVNLVGKSVTFLEPLKPPVRANSPVTTVPVLRFYSLKTLVFSACTEWHEYALRAGRQPPRPPIFAMPET